MVVAVMLGFARTFLQMRQRAGGFPRVGRLVRVGRVARAAHWWAARVNRFSFYLELEIAL
jgi:hypothetical protein